MRFFHSENNHTASITRTIVHAQLVPNGDNRFLDTQTPYRIVVRTNSING